MYRLHIVSAALLLAGCSARGGPSTPPPASPEAAPIMPTTLPTTVVTPRDAADIVEIYTKAEQDLERGEAASAAAGFERVARVEPDGELAPRAWLRASEAREQLGNRQAAIARLEQFVRRRPDHPLATEALLRLVRLHAHTENWERTGWAASALLPDVRRLPPLNQVVTYGGKGLSLAFAGKADAAEFFVEKGRNVVDDHQLDRAGRLPRDLAMLYFALGEIRRTRAEAIRFAPRPPNFGEVLERRCQLLLDAQSAYSDTMRAYDAHWSAMAGYRVGELYQSLHRDLMAVPPPKTADTGKRRFLFEAAMRLRYAVLLEKARAMLDHTLAMAERTQERSQWIERTRAARTDIDRAIVRENAVIDSLPFSRDDLRAALDELGAKAREKGIQSEGQSR